LHYSLYSAADKVYLFNHDWMLSELIGKLIGTLQQ
jgi:hypothetical protein